ncbi:MAG: hypothetical protein HYU66_03350 [Armatimonadetes bacterium]|nr:hypothetical protein [Armatimonadota bacterium]
MLPRERVQAALEYRAPDVVPARIYASPAGLYEHGARLLDLIKACGHDFGDLSGLTLPDPPPPTDFDPDGRYHVIRTDAWGTTWEYRLFGIWGHPIGWPLNDWAALDSYQPPSPPPAAGPGVDAGREAIARQREVWYQLGGGGSLFETLHSVRRFEEVLLDLAAGEPNLERLEDLICGHAAGCVAHALALDVDAVCFGDDYGTQEALLVSPATWRRFFKPRYERLFAPVRAAGKPIFFHVCGKVDALLEDFAELGVNAIWPQLTAFDVPDLARRCRELGLCVELHPDRGDLMQRGPAGAVRDYLLRLTDTFRTAEGGSWLYLEVDPGFLWPNVETLYETAMELRAGAPAVTA